MSIKMQRIAITIIGVVMLVGTLGAYFLVIWQNNSTTDSTQNTSTTDQTQQAAKTVDPTAYIVKDKISELKVQDLTVGSGAEAKAGDTVRVHYKGTLAQTGVKFDSSYDTGEPITLSLANVIKGWQDGIPGMKVGGKRRLLIPSADAYGPTGSGPIPANADLIFEVELLAVNPAQ